MSELKPCPFCGKENTVAGSTERMILGWWYACEDCFENRKGGVHEDRWNTRPIEDALRKRIDELEAQLAEEVKYEINEKVRKGKSICEACGGDGSLLLTDGYKGQVVATVECIYCNGTGYVDESPNDTQTDSVVYGKDSD